MKKRFLYDFLTFSIICLILFFYLSILKTNNNNLMDYFNIKLNTESSLHRFYSELKLANVEKIKRVLNNENSYTQSYKDLYTNINTEIIYRNKFSAFSDSGFFVSPENKGLLKISVLYNKNIKNIILPYSYFRYTSPFSSHFSLYIRNLSQNPNVVLNNSNGKSINFKEVMNIKENEGIIHFGTKTILNLPVKTTDNNIYNPIPKDQEMNDHIYKYTGCDINIKNNVLFKEANLKKHDYYSSFFRFYNATSNFKHSGNLFKGLYKKVYKKNKNQNNIPIPFSKEDFSDLNKNISSKLVLPYFSENKIQNISERDNMESLLINKFDSIEDNMFFKNRVTIKTNSLNKYYSNNPIPSLDLDKNILFIDKNVVYIPYIEVIKSGGVIIAPRDIYIDTVKNPLNKPLTIVSLNGNILIGNTIHASLIANSSNGKISGIYKSRKKVYGNIICNDLDINSFKKGIDLIYTDIFKEKKYNFNINKIPAAIY